MHIEIPPFSILALGPFSPELDTERPPVVTVNSLSLNDAVAAISPTLNIPVDKNLCPDGNIAITIKKMADFRPKNISKNTLFIKEILEAKAYVKNGGNPADLEIKYPRTAQLITIPAATRSGKSESKASAIDDIMSMVDTDANETSSPISCGSSSIGDQIDTIHDKLLQTVFADPNFRMMEGTWRGAELLTRQIPSGTEPTVNLTLVPLPKGDCIPVFDMLESELADTPPDLILVDKQIINTPRAMAELERIMTFAETMLAPAAVPIGPKFLEISNWKELKSVRFIPSLLEGAEYGRWKTLRTQSGAGWIVPCVSGIMTRPKHQSESTPLWSSSAWAIGALCGKSIATHGRPTRFSDRGSVRIEDLPLTEGPAPAPLEIMLDSERRTDFKQVGILPLVAAPGKDQAFVTTSITMDGGPLNFRMFLSQLTGFIIRLSETHSAEIVDIEIDLAKAISLFMQALGFSVPSDLKITAGENTNGSVPLEITFTPDSEILTGGQPFTFGFNW
ncbi:MAG: hypothetical protein BA863_16785 [Desulfovibrio sp. S3730MH75]|nr:MAG: hypothetical protein BA863_16785 [Desulfovibrio sp. S3730MH75]